MPHSNIRFPPLPFFISFHSALGHAIPVFIQRQSFLVPQPPINIPSPSTLFSSLSPSSFISRVYVLFPTIFPSVANEYPLLLELVLDMFSAYTGSLNKYDLVSTFQGKDNE